MPLKNWAGNLTYRTSNVHYPETVEEVQETVKRLDKVRGLGSRHCFNTIADSPDNQVSLKNMNKIVSLDRSSNTVTVEAGIRYGELCPYLHENGYALHNLASLPHISIGGACATATHGSGVKNGNLASSVVQIQVVNASGEWVTFSRDKNNESFNGAVVGLGGLGIVTHLTLEVLPAFDMAQRVYLDLPVESLIEHFDEIMGSGYSVSLFSDFQSETVNQVWIKDKVSGGQSTAHKQECFGAQAVDRDVHPIIELSAESCTEQLGVVGPWFRRLPHFRMEFTPSSGKELQAEYFVPCENGAAAYKAIQGLRNELGPLLMISEIRSVEGDDLWMSPCYKRPSYVFHFTLEQDAVGVGRLLPEIESALEPFGARPHWGKLFTISSEKLRERYPKLLEFRDLVNEIDPNGKFRNEFLERTIFG